MKKILKYICLLLCLIYFNVKGETTSIDATFVRCVDGDTAVFNVNNEEVKFRFLAIDTPETVHPTKAVEAFGKDASEYTCNKLTSAESIILEYESSNTTDKYGRSLAWIWVDGSLLQKELIEVGYARVAYIYGNYRYTSSLCLYQSKATIAKVGIWEDSTEVGYCETIDLSDVKDNIIFSNINVTNSSSESEEEQNINVVEQINNIENTVSNYLEENEISVNKYIKYFIIAAAVIYVVIKEAKK